MKIKNTVDTVEKNVSERIPASNTLPNQIELNSSMPINRTPFYITKGLTKENMDALYFLANHLYQKEKYEEARPFFQLMAFLDIGDRRGWIGAAACLEATKQYKAAIGCYGCAAMLDQSDPMPLLRSFNCYLEINDKEKALTALEAAIEVAHKQEGLYANLKEQAQKIKEVLLK